MEFNHITSIV